MGGSPTEVASATSVADVAARFLGFSSDEVPANLEISTEYRLGRPEEVLTLKVLAGYEDNARRVPRYHKLKLDQFINDTCFRDDDAYRSEGDIISCKKAKILRSALMMAGYFIWGGVEFAAEDLSEISALTMQIREADKKTIEAGDKVKVVGRDEWEHEYKFTGTVISATYPSETDSMIIYKVKVDNGNIEVKIKESSASDPENVISFETGYLYYNNNPPFF